MVLELEDPARVVVVGGGPSGTFFAIRLLKRARELGRAIELTIVEKKKELQFYEHSNLFRFREGCNYCAGGLSPRMVDALEAEGLAVPDEVNEGEVSALTVQGGWKNVELNLPPGRRMTLVYRGSRPRDRVLKYLNFDAFLLESALEEGAEVVTGTVEALGYGAEGRPWIEYRVASGDIQQLERREADFLVFAAGVNQIPGMALEASPLAQSLQRAIPRYRPPRVRRTLIFELEVEERFATAVEGDVYFAELGAREMHIEMFSMVPKGRYITVAMIGKTIDTSRPADNHRIIERFLELPSIRRILPREVVLDAACSCNPNMTVGQARRPFAHRLALTGDMVASRLYKDGIYSAYLTGTALASCALERGIDARSLRRGYLPTVRQIHRDNYYGAVMFRLNRIAMSRPLLSRVLYQAILTERRMKARSQRLLGDVIYKVVSGDDSYRNIWQARLRPRVVWRILSGGLFVTLRNVLTEFVFGLPWHGFGRHPTGVYRETREYKRAELGKRLGLKQLEDGLQFERMHSIKIRASKETIWKQLARFGDGDKEYFRPRWIRIERLAGEPNEKGCTIRYATPLGLLDFCIHLEQLTRGESLVYRVVDGFAAGGVLVFELEEFKPGVQALSIYVAFDFPRGRRMWSRLGWRLFRRLFPDYVHDVLWNHALCKFKDVAEH